MDTSVRLKMSCTVDPPLVCMYIIIFTIVPVCLFSSLVSKSVSYLFCGICVPCNDSDSNEKVSSDNCGKVKD